MTISRTGWFSLPFIGSAHAMRCGHSHGLGLEFDRAAGDATLWIGRWQIDVSAKQGVSVVAVAPVLAVGAALIALAPLPRSVRT